MFSKKPNIKIEKIDNVDIHYPFHPWIDKIIVEHLKNREKNTLTTPSKNYEQTHKNKSKFLNSVDLLSKIVSILSGIAIIVFIVLLWLGHTTIGTIQVSTLLTIISFTLVGGIVSIGGVQMFSLNASLRKAENKVEKIFTKFEGCPFLGIQLETKNPNWENYEPGNPRFCVKCPLGIDIGGKEEDGLIHICKLYPDLYQKWSANNPNRF